MKRLPQIATTTSSNGSHAAPLALSTQNSAASLNGSQSTPSATSTQNPGTSSNGSQSTSSATSTQNPLKFVGYTFRERVKIVVIGYWASFILTGVMIPIVASITLVILYFSSNNVALLLAPIIPPGLHSAWGILILAHCVTIIIWLIAAIVCYPFATAHSANPESYGLIKSSMCQIRAKLGIKSLDYEMGMLEQKHEDIKKAIEHIHKLDQPNYLENEQNRAAIATALASYIEIQKMLFLTPTGLLWVFGSGYCALWQLLHQAEEALIEFECSEELIYGAMGDKMILQSSTLSAKDDLLNSLIEAVIVLEPAARIYLKEHQPTKDNSILADIKKRFFNEVLLRHNVLLQHEVNQISKAKAATARSALRRVRRAINTLQDRGWEGLLRARNRLLSSIAITGIVTHVMLCITILLTFNNNSTLSSTDPLIAATAFYMVGAVTGLFGRFYSESMSRSAVDDFGFSTARLIATPLLSGLAGIGGVLLLITLTALSGSVLSASNSSLGLAQIFVIKPYSLLMAAVFGLTPNLLIKGLQDTAKKYESDIQSSKIKTIGTNTTDRTA